MIYIIDDMQLAVLKRVETRLYDEMTRLTADDRRDLANAMNAVRYQVESCALSETEATEMQGLAIRHEKVTP